MPHSKSAQKEVRKAQKRYSRNKSIRSSCKTKITKAEKLLLSGEVDKGRGAVADAISALDKASEKKIIHANNAARRKSRLMKKMNQAQFASENTGQ